MYRKNNTFFNVWVTSLVCFVFSIFPSASLLYGEEIMGREVEEFSGTLKNGLPVEHHLLVCTEGTMSLALSFVGGNSTILLEVFDRDNKNIYNTQIPMAGQFIIHDLPAGNYLLRLTPIQKVQEELSYQLKVLMPKTTYIEEEEVPLASPENFAGTKPFPFSAYAMLVLMILWGILAVYLYRFLRNWEQRGERKS